MFLISLQRQYERRPFWYPFWPYLRISRNLGVLGMSHFWVCPGKVSLRVSLVPDLSFPGYLKNDPFLAIPKGHSRITSKMVLGKGIPGTCQSLPGIRDANLGVGLCLGVSLSCHFWTYPKKGQKRGVFGGFPILQPLVTFGGRQGIEKGSKKGQKWQKTPFFQKKKSY